jgi:hypothetical protein
MIKKIILTISAAAVFATSAVANELCSIGDVGTLGIEYLKKVSDTDFFKAFDNLNKKMNKNDLIVTKATIEGGTEGALSRIQKDKQINDMSLTLKDKNGYTYNITIKQAIQNCAKYYFYHLPLYLINDKDPHKGAGERISEAANALYITDLFYMFGRYNDFKNNFIKSKTFKWFNDDIKAKDKEFAKLDASVLMLKYTKEIKDWVKIIKSNTYKGDLYAVALEGLIEGYIELQRDPRLKSVVPEIFIDFAVAVMSGNFDKADEILKKINETLSKLEYIRCQ